MWSLNTLRAPSSIFFPSPCCSLDLLAFRYLPLDFIKALVHYSLAVLRQRFLDTHSKLNGPYARPFDARPLNRMSTIVALVALAPKSPFGKLRGEGQETLKPRNKWPFLYFSYKREATTWEGITTMRRGTGMVQISPKS